MSQKQRLATLLNEPEPFLQLGILLAETFRQQALQTRVFFLERNEILQVTAVVSGCSSLLPLIVGLLRYAGLPCGILDALAAAG